MQQRTPPQFLVEVIIQQGIMPALGLVAVVYAISTVYGAAAQNTQKVRHPLPFIQAEAPRLPRPKT